MNLPLSSIYRRILIHRIILLSVCLMAGLSLGCGQQGNPKDVAEIKTNYTAFRSALIVSNFDRAKEFVSRGYGLVYSPEWVQDSYGRFLGTNGLLTDKAYIRFGPDRRAWLWPRARPEIGSTGIGFIRQTNGWKIEGDFIKVAD